MSLTALNLNTAVENVPLLHIAQKAGFNWHKSSAVWAQPDSRLHASGMQPCQGRCVAQYPWGTLSGVCLFKRAPNGGIRRTSIISALHYHNHRIVICFNWWNPTAGFSESDCKRIVQTVTLVPRESHWTGLALFPSCPSTPQQSGKTKEFRQ